MDGKKQYAIKHWLELTCDNAKKEVEISLKDAPFQYGPFGESLSVMKFLFLTSTVQLLCLPNASLVPVNGEESVALDWNLPLGPVAQEILFSRIRTSFEKATTIIENPADRKKYKMGEEELLALRNLVVIYASVRDFLAARMKGFPDFDRMMRTSSMKDQDFREVMDSRPPRFAMSMLPSTQRAALEDAQAREEGQTLEAEKERLKLRETRWAYFKTALERDQKSVKHIQEAPGKVQALRHRKQVAWRLQQAELGEKVVNSFMEKFLRCELVGKMELAQARINEFRTFVVP